MKKFTKNKEKKTKDKTEGFIKFVKHNYLVAFLVFFGFIGILTLLVTRAATSVTSFEPEKSAPNQMVIDNVSASGGKAIKFGSITGPGPSWWKPSANTRWQWVLEGQVPTTQADLNRFEMWDIDLTDAIPSAMTQEIVYPGGEKCQTPDGKCVVNWPKGANAAAFTALKAAGKKVVCYMDTGAFEDYEPDAKFFPGKWGGTPSNQAGGTRGNLAYVGPATWSSIDVLGSDSQDSAGGTFNGEYWLDLTESSWKYYAPIIWARFEVAKKIGCDGIEGDQNNTYGNDKFFGASEAKSLRWYREVYYQTHLRGMSAISKNGVELTSQQVTNPTNIPYCTPGMCIPDGILNEECHQYGECADLNPATSKGLWVGQVEYRGNSTAVCPDAKAKGRMAMKKPENYSVTQNILWACWET
jgi:hypothetical protein